MLILKGFCVIQFDAVYTCVFKMAIGLYVSFGLRNFVLIRNLFFVIKLQPLFKIDHTILIWPVFFVNCDFSEVGIFFRNLISDNEFFMF
jgi:hypothetical protein